MLEGITPTGKQNEVLALPTRGHIIVLGAAGSGKTTIAALRALHLSNLASSNCVLFVTFNNALVEHILYLLAGRKQQTLTVETYHKFARGYLNSRGKMSPSNCILAEKDELIRQAIEAIKVSSPDVPVLKRSLGFFCDEIRFIQKFGFNDSEEYYSAERIGRSAAYIKREERYFVYEVFEEYKRLREANGFNYDWDDLAYYTYLELEQDDSEKRYDHIIVDEGQDFSPTMIKSLVCAVNQGGSFTFFGDVAQQIYGSRLSWRDSGIDARRIWRFDMNYRNPIAISNFAKDLTESEYWVHSDDMIESTNYIAAGPLPVLMKFTDKRKELEWVTEQAIETSKDASVVIICRTNMDVEQYQHSFHKRQVYVKEIQGDQSSLSQAKLNITTFHSAKGLEFDYVFIPYLSDQKLPDPTLLSKTYAEKEAYSDELRLLYVAVTRTRYGLYMTYHGNLSLLFPANSQNVQREQGK